MTKCTATYLRHNKSQRFGVYFTLNMYTEFYPAVYFSLTFGPLSLVTVAHSVNDPYAYRHKNALVLLYFNIGYEKLQNIYKYFKILLIL